MAMFKGLKAMMCGVVVREIIVRLLDVVMLELVKLVVVIGWSMVVDRLGSWE